MTITRQMLDTDLQSWFLNTHAFDKNKKAASEVLQKGLEI